ncbi:hypothetical protein Tco_0004262 [Tanacetum coccineum]
MGMAEEENASLRGKIKTMEATDTVTRRHEKRARMELERQLTSVQEAQRQDQENFRKLQENADWDCHEMAMAAFVSLILRVGSIEPFENPSDTRKLESSSYHALGACLDHILLLGDESDMASLMFFGSVRLKDGVDRKYACLTFTWTAMSPHFLVPCYERFGIEMEFDVLNIERNVSMEISPSADDVASEKQRCERTWTDAQKNKGTLAALSIVRAASTRVRFRLSTTPFCSGVRAVDVSLS